MRRRTLLERLGRSPGSRLLILSCGGLGCSHASNVGVYSALQGGVATTARILVPAPWARDAASRYRGEDVGVDLTLNAENDRYRWGPVTHSPSLLDGDGGFPRTAEDTWEHADLDELRRECRAQVERAVYWGFDVSHLSSHLDVLVAKPELFDTYLELALELRLPMSLPGAAVERAAGFPFRSLAEEEGAIVPDTVVSGAPGAGRRLLEKVLGEVGPGVTEVVFTPAADTPELRALWGNWAGCSDDLAALTADSAVTAMLARSGVELVGYRELRQLALAAD